MKKSYLFFLLITLSCIPLLDLLHPGLPVTHDGQDHVARIANFYQNLQEGNIIPRWAGNLNWGYGHPILMFLYPLPSYVASFFHVIGFSFVDSLKIVFGLAYIASGITMFIFVKDLLNEEAGLVASVLYLFAPYRFVDLYVRGAIGEHVAFIFPPLILYALHKLTQGSYKKKYLILGSCSIAGLLLSHNAISLMFFPFIILYAAYNVMRKQKKKQLVIAYCFAFLFGFGLAAFFWLPAFFEGKYTLRDIVTKDAYRDRFESIGRLLYSSWNYNGTGIFSVQVGLWHWASVLGGVIAGWKLYKNKNPLWIPTLVLVVSFFISIFLMTSSSILIWEKITTLQKFQFPWRLLSVTVFISAFLGGIFIYSLKVKIKYVILFLIISVIIFINRDYWHANGYLLKSDSFYSSIYDGTTDTGESGPIWSVRFMEKRPTSHMQVINGKAHIEEITHTSTAHQYKVNVLESTRLRENTLFFPGWEIFIDGNKTNIEFQDPRHRGVMTFEVSKGEHMVKVLFRETKLRFIADTISLLSFGVIMVLLLFPYSKKI